MSSKAVNVSKECKSNSNELSSSTSSSSSIEIYVSNVVCSFSTKCHLNLRKIGLEGMHVEYERGGSKVTMRMRKPLTTALIYSSGKINCTGATSEAEAYIAARRYCRILQRMNFKVRLTNYRVVNVLATCLMPFTIDIKSFADTHHQVCSYEPELNAGAHYRIHDLKSTLIIFNTGSINMTVPSVSHAQRAISYIYPLLYPFRREYISPPIKHVECNQKIECEKKAALPKIEEEKKDEPLEPIRDAESSSVSIETTTQLKIDMPVFDPVANDNHADEEISLNILDSHIEEVLNEAYSLHECSEYFQPDGIYSSSVVNNNNFYMTDANLLANSSQSSNNKLTSPYYSNSTNCINIMLNSSQGSSNWIIDNVFDDFLP